MRFIVSILTMFSLAINLYAFNVWDFMSHPHSGYTNTREYALNRQQAIEHVKAGLRLMIQGQS